MDNNQNTTESGTADTSTHREKFRINGEQMVEKVKEIIAEGNATRIIIKNEKDVTLLEVPLTIGALGAMLAPALAAIGALAALVSKCTIIVEKKVISA